MKRLIALSLLALGLAAGLGASTVLGAQTDPVHGPKCSDITLNIDSYLTNPDGQTATLTGSISIAGGNPSCTNNATYTLYVNGVAAATFQGDGVTSVFPFSVTTSNSANCISAASLINEHVSDSAPDFGCAMLVPSSSGSGGFSFN